MKIEPVQYYLLAAELDMLAEAGFAQPECFWKYGRCTAAIADGAEIAGPANAFTPG